MGLNVGNLGRLSLGDAHSARTLANATPNAAELLPVLALSGADITGVENAFDLGITPPELLTIGPTEDPGVLAHLEQLEELAYNTAFDVIGQSGSTTLQARVTRGSTHLGDITLQIAVEDDARRGDRHERCRSTRPERIIRDREALL